MSNVIPLRSVKCSESYELGYKEGEASASADWCMELEEEFGLEDLTGPTDFIERSKARAAETLEASRHVALWLRGALDCKQWNWDADQREAAEDAYSKLMELLQGGKA